MPDDARRPARLQGRDGAEDARTTHPCICRWLGMLAEEPWEYSTMGKMGFNAYPDTTGHFCWWLAVQKHVGLMVLVEDTYAVETDPSMSARSWITCSVEVREIGHRVRDLRSSRPGYGSQARLAPPRLQVPRE